MHIILRNNISKDGRNKNYLLDQLNIKKIHPGAASTPY